MEPIDHRPKVAGDGERTPFTVWLGRTLRASHEDAVHEPIPAALLDLLPPPATQR